MVRVLVYGGRNYSDRPRVFAELDALHAETPITTVIQGEARGVDRFAKRWAQAMKIPTEDYAADWDDLQAPAVRAKKRTDGTFYNANAGNTRNLLMMTKGKPDVAVEFPGDAGTANMRRIVRAEMHHRALRYIRITK